MNKLGCILLICLGWLWLCSHQSATPLFPKPFPKPIYDLASNPLQKDVIDLGRRFFYDPILSKNNTISCASCHSPYNAFAHVDHALSHGIYDRIGFRNAPALFNLAWAPYFMQDGAIHHLDMQALAPISDSNEMQETFDHVMHANVMGAMMAIPQVAPMVETAAGVFACISSVMGSLHGTCSSDAALYRVSKAALNMVVRTSQPEYPHARFVALHPGWVQTEMGGSGATLTVEDAVTRMRHTLAHLTPEQAGQFLSYDGSTLAW